MQSIEFIVMVYSPAVVVKPFSGHFPARYYPAVFSARAVPGPGKPLPRTHGIGQGCGALSRRRRSFPNLHFVSLDAHVADISSDLRARYGLCTPDAIQVATAIHQRADAFVTNDEGLRRIKEMKITLPRAAG